MPSQSNISGGSSGETNVIVRGNRVVTPDGERAATIHIKDGLITKVSDFNDVSHATVIYEARDFAIMPGLVDTHVHINEPGRTEWEGFSTATRAAAAGGITTLIEMPLNSIPATTSVGAFQEKLAATAGKLSVDVGFWGGVVPGNARELPALWEAGCFGFKCFLIDSGVKEFASVVESDLRDALPVLARMGAPLLVHAELPGPIESAAKIRAANASGKSHQTWLESRPRAAENDAIALLLRLASEFGVRIHIVHLSSADAIPQIQGAKASGRPLSVETCPHYLMFTSEEIPNGATMFKCAPPIRERENRERLWAGLRDATIDMIATDHSPCPPEMKRPEIGDFLDAWGGIASLQLSLPGVWKEAKPRGFSLMHLSRWLCETPARLAGLAHKKGSIAPGRDADLVIWNPEAGFKVDPTELHHRHKLTPYAGRDLMGIVEATFLRGQKIFDRGNFCAAPAGRILLRGK
ncbi:MAG TPA: allantoinase AllB [Candidatus Sulfotelmatobacter sp.]|nr:allantoinase AllB [Candidatus Sulfotelmatobacter sp.]